MRPSPGAPPLDWWVIAARTYQSKTDHRHYATMAEGVVEIPVLSMCPEKVCTFCGLAPKRITEPTPEYADRLGQSIFPKADQEKRRVVGRRGAHEKEIAKQHVHVGWDECDCFDFPGRWRRGIVLDPFGGTGTTAAVAQRFGRDAVLIDFDERNVAIVEERIQNVVVQDLRDPLCPYGCGEPVEERGEPCEQCYRERVDDPSDEHSAEWEFGIG